MSLKMRLFLTHGAVALLALLTVAIGVLLLLRTYADRQSLNRLEDMARPIRVQTQAVIRNGGGLSNLAPILQEQATENDTYIMLIDSLSGDISEIIPNPPPVLGPYSGSLFEPRKLNLSGRGRYVAKDGRIFLYIAYSINSQGSLLTHADRLVLATPRPRSLVLLLAVAWPFLIAAAIALILSLLLSFLLARSIYRPLGRITTAVRRVARGDYSQKIEPSGPGELKELAESFNVMSDSVARAQQQLQSFVADVSHEIRSPLTAIQGFAQALTDGTAADDATRLKAAHIIDQEARRLKKQADELLELARLDTAQIRLVKERLDVRDLLNRSTEIYTVPASDKKVSLELHTEAGLSISGDADRLEQVFNNLLDNAVKNSPASGRIVVTSRQSDDAVLIEVADEGPGIPGEQLGKVFERFYQVAGVRTGVGLGLAIARSIVLAHGGTIEALNEPGSGAKFVVRLPRGD